MICPKCSFEQGDETKECAKCGVVFENYLKTGTAAPPGVKSSPQEREVEVKHEISVKDLLVEVEVETNPFYFGGRALLFFIPLAFLAWGGYLLFRQFRNLDLK